MDLMGALPMHQSLNGKKTMFKDPVLTIKFAYLYLKTVNPNHPNALKRIQ
jgi:hypothetical protein